MGRAACPGVFRLAWLAWEKPGPSKRQFMSFLMPGQKVTGLNWERDYFVCLQSAD